MKAPRTPANPPPSSTWSGSSLFSRSSTIHMSMPWFRIAGRSAVWSFSAMAFRWISNRSFESGMP